ncbi:hypothetical protein NDN08_002834 [Rhodosorus marinus]|uniref:Uncharacterized protein n=1 Tax=Rhodosorus marinus TaxID=101924 RepID=A0AAV8V0L8_9RHOD|nr:hypothetical protein NDN08_002834 [Rhodosorus marinus]
MGPKRQSSGISNGEDRDGVGVRGSWGCSSSTRRLSRLVFQRLVAPASVAYVEELMSADQHRVLVLRGEKQRIGAGLAIDAAIAALEDYLLAPVQSEYIQDEPIVSSGHLILVPRAPGLETEVSILTSDTASLPRHMFAVEKVQAKKAKKQRVIKVGDGDALFVPRGVLISAGKEPVLGFCLNTGWLWADLIGGCISDLVDRAAEHERGLRQTLPTRTLSTFGAAVKKPARQRKGLLLQEYGARLAKKSLARQFDIDYAADQLAKRFFSRRKLPPMRLPEAYEPVDQDTLVRLLFSSVLRIIVSGNDGQTQVLYCSGSGRGEITCTAQEANAISFLCRRYPRWIPARAIPMESEEDRLNLARCLRSMGALALGTDRDAVDLSQRQWFSPGST